MNMKTITAILIIFTLGGCYQTQNSVGTTPFKAAVSDCTDPKHTIKDRCLINHHNYANYTAAEKAMLAYITMVEQKVRSGELTRAEGDFLNARYMQQAKSLSDASEAQQAAAFSAQMNALSANMNNLAASAAIQNQVLINQQQALQPPPMPTQTRCWRNGYYVNCQSW
jgi:hypothetical protein